jgi:hypothetical protein
MELKAMELVSRYLQAVKFWLPKEQKDDILAEISADIQSQIEDRESSLGRPLTQSEVEDILKQRGRPCLVASRFRRQESLIGPVLYPIYLFCLKCALLGYLVPWLLLSLIILIVRPSFSAPHSIPAWFNIMAQVSGSLWNMAFIAAGTITLVFAILERLQAKSHWLENWDPRKLPPVRNPSVHRRTNAAFELAIIVLAIAWWAAYMDRTVIYLGESVRFDLKPEWLWFFWSYLFVLVLTAATAALILARPHMAWLTAALRLFNSLVGSILFCSFLRVGILAGIAIQNVPPQKAIEFTNTANHWLLSAFPYGVIVSVVIIATDVYRIVRATSRTSTTPESITG